MTQEKYSIKKVLIERDGCSMDEADELLAEARREVAEGHDPARVCEDFFGLEPDYVWELM